MKVMQYLKLHILRSSHSQYWVFVPALFRTLTITNLHVIRTRYCLWVYSSLLKGMLAFIVWDAHLLIQCVMDASVLWENKQWVTSHIIRSDSYWVWWWRMSWGIMVSVDLFEFEGSFSSFMTSGWLCWMIMQLQRMDTLLYLLVYPQRPLLSTKSIELVLSKHLNISWCFLPTSLRVWYGDCVC